MTFSDLAQMITSAGGTVSAGSYEDEHSIHVFSKQSVKGCFGHPKHTAHFSKATGWVTPPTGQPYNIQQGDV